MNRQRALHGVPPLQLSDEVRTYRVDLKSNLSLCQVSADLLYPEFTRAHAVRRFKTCSIQYMISLGKRLCHWFHATGAEGKTFGMGVILGFQTIQRMAFQRRDVSAD